MITVPAPEITAALGRDPSNVNLSRAGNIIT